MRLGIDIDGTIKNTHEAARSIYNEKLNRNVQSEDITDFYLDQAYGLTPQEGKALWRSLESKIYTVGLPMPHASEVLNDLASQGHQITYITARPGLYKIEKITKHWLQQHGFPYTGENLIMNAQDKAEVAHKLQIDLFFEDAPDHLQNLIRKGIRTVIMDANYNRDFPHKAQRMDDWRQVYDLIDRYR
ncbi:5' nucleotidase, NT5C type [Polycladospora coralii]|nr:hypothetical protein [Polycladospora coralii]